MKFFKSCFSHTPEAQHKQTFSKDLLESKTLKQSERFFANDKDKKGCWKKFRKFVKECERRHIC